MEYDVKKDLKRFGKLDEPVDDKTAAEFKQAIKDLQDCMVTKPNHYQTESGHDLFWHMQHGLFTDAENRAIMKFNILRYVMRHDRKNEKQDLAKGLDYLLTLAKFEYGEDAVCYLKKIAKDY